MFFDWIIFILRRKNEDCRQAPFGTSHKKVIIWINIWIYAIY